MSPVSLSIDQTLSRPVEVSPRPQAAAADMGIMLRVARMAAHFAPTFTVAEEPLQDGRVYTALDGTRYARPQLRLGHRGGSFPGPDVLFLREIDGSTHLHIGLTQVLADDGSANVLSLGDISGPPRIEWRGGSLPLPAPTPVEDPGGDRGALRILVPLTPDQVAALVAAMTDAAAGTQLVADYALSYRVRENAADPGPIHPRPRPWPRPRPRWQDDGMPPITVQPLMHIQPFPFSPATEAGQLVATAAPMAVRLQPIRAVTAAGVADPTALSAGAGATLLDPPVQMRNAALMGPSAFVNPDLIERWKDRQVIDVPDIDIAVPEPQTRAVDQTLGRRVPFFFDRTLDQNAAIFRAISGAASLPADWQDSEWGTLRPAEFVNTVYLLPHEFRLAYDAARGLPNMLPVQYAAPDGSRRLRVLLRAEPWYDPARVGGLQAALSRQTAGAFVHPQVIAGGVQGAAVTLNTIFPEEITVGGGAAITIDVAVPFDVTLDLTEEYYALLTAVLTGPIGLTGSVEVTLAPATDAAPAPVRRVPLALSFQRLGALPLTHAVGSATVNPDHVRLTNRAGQAVTVGGAEAALLLLDANALMPAAMLAARPVEPLPLTLVPGGSTTLTFAPVAAPEGAVWNAVVPVLSSVTAAVDPDAALRAIHALAPPGSFGWRLRILSPQLTQAATPAADQMVAVEIRMTPPDGAAPVQATLMAAEPERVLTFPRSLDDLTGGGTGDGFLRLSVIARGVWPAGFGPWSDPVDHVGDTLFVFVPDRPGAGG